MEELNNIRNRILDNRLSYKWLIYQLENRGIITDKSEISSVFAGTRKGKKADSIIQNTNDILNEYESKFSIREA